MPAADFQAVKYEQRHELPEQKYFLTTAIAYVNGKPHVGHAYEFAAADVICRYHRIAGRDTYFLTGSDEHGQKVADTAAKAGKEPKAFCDEMVKLFIDLDVKLDISYDQYIRTTNPEHEKFANWLWKRAEENGDIYLGTYSGWYNVKEEAFITEREAEANDFKDPGSGIPYEKRNEECYFFKLGNYHDQLLSLISETDYAQPLSRRNELIQRLNKEPLEDLCISRSTLTWGVPVDGKPGHVMYVWFDALANYISATAYDDPSSKLAYLWPADCHLIGKDITWFHCIIWPAMLMSAKLPIPRVVYGHGFVQCSAGTKMSKSLGNVVDPITCIEFSSSDTFRWYVIREGHFGADIRFSAEALVDMHNADLCSTLGNLLHRAVALCIKNCDGKIPSTNSESTLFNLVRDFEAAEKAMYSYILEDLAAIGIEICKTANKYLTEKEPWKIQEAEPKAAIIRAVLEALYVAAHFLLPVIPGAAQTIVKRLGHPFKKLYELSPESNLVPGTQVVSGDVLFEQLDITKFVVNA